MGLVIATFFGALTFIGQYQAIRRIVIADAFYRLDLALLYTPRIASQSGLAPRLAFQQALADNLFIQPRQKTYGDFVYGLFYDSLGRKSEFLKRKHLLMPLARKFVRNAPRRFPKVGKVWHEVIRLNDKAHIHLVTAVTLEGTKMVEGYLDIIFAVSPEATKVMQSNAIKTMAYVLGIVLTTTALLYPVIIHLTRRLAQESKILLRSNLETLAVLGSAVAKRDSDTDAHNYRVTIYSVRLAEALNLDSDTIQRLIKGALLHDVGKIGIRDEILLKPGPLTLEEFSIMQTHVLHGRDIVYRSKWLEDAADVVCSHHERFNGSGYPARRRGYEIPLVARVFTVADVFDALTSRRPYKAPYPYATAIKIMKEARGEHFEPYLLDLFLSIAPALYEKYNEKGEAILKSALDEIINQYFSAGLKALTY